MWESFTLDIASLLKDRLTAAALARKGNVENGRNPKDLNELVEKKTIPKLPDAPRGMKLDYDATAGKVKVVPQ